jgi:hypothetical protein
MKSIGIDEIAYARSGDKGSSANIAVFASDDRQYDWLRQRLNEKVVEDFSAPLGVKKVTRYEVPDLARLISFSTKFWQKAAADRSGSMPKEKLSAKQYLKWNCRPDLLTSDL